jgi:hypothetical protein
MSETWPTRPSTTPAGPGHEKYELRLVPVLLFGIVLVLVTTGVLLLMSTLFNSYASRRAQQDVPPLPLAQTRSQLPPEPRLQVSPPRELQQLRAAEEATLTSYGWVEQSEGIVRIPIERAMALLAERGLPTRPQASVPERKSP